MTTRNCGSAGVLVAEKSCPRKVSETAGPHMRAGLGLVLFLLLCLTISSSVLAAQQQSGGSNVQEQNASAKEVDQLRKEVNELREDLKRLHTLLESRGAVSETAIAPAPQPAAALQPAAPSTGVVAQAAQPAPGETGVPSTPADPTIPELRWQQKLTAETCPVREISCERTE